MLLKSDQSQQYTINVVCPVLARHVARAVVPSAHMRIGDVGSGHGSEKRRKS